MSPEHLPAKTRSTAAQKLSILLVGAADDTGSGGWSIFHHSPWRTRHARDCGEALPLVGRDAHHVIVSERQLPDGNWRDVLDAAAARANPPVLIVPSRLADERLWAEVLNLGGYDVRVKPFGVEIVEHSAPRMNPGGAGCLLRFLAPGHYASRPRERSRTGQMSEQQ